MWTLEHILLFYIEIVSHASLEDTKFFKRRLPNFVFNVVWAANILAYRRQTCMSAPLSRIIQFQLIWTNSLGETFELSTACEQRLAQKLKEIVCGLCSKLYNLRCRDASRSLHILTTAVANTTSWTCGTGSFNSAKDTRTTISSQKGA